MAAMLAPAGTCRRVLLLVVALLMARHRPASSKSPPPSRACPQPHGFEHGSACLCVAGDAAAACGELPDAAPASASHALIVTSSLDGGFMQTEEVPLRVASPASGAQMQINVGGAGTLQTVHGFGGAITDATAAQYASFPADLQTQFIRMFFGEANFSFVRLPMNGVDFSAMNYALAHRSDLSDWCLRDDTTPDGQQPACGRDYKLDPIKAASLLQPSDLKVLISTWSAPPSFKNQSFTCAVIDGTDICTPVAGGPPAVGCNVSVSNPVPCRSSANSQGEPCPTVPPTHIKPQVSSLTPETPLHNAGGNCWSTGFVWDLAAWAAHFRTFVQALRNASVPVWGVTAQNEPLTNTGLWPSNFYTPENEIDFVSSYLSPTLKAAFGADFKVLVHDDQVTTLASRALGVAQTSGTHADGVAYHWYNALEGTFENGTPEHPLGLPKWIVGNLVNGGADVKKLYDALNGNRSDAANGASQDEKIMLMTEACSGYSLGTSWVGPRHGEWGYGYATSHDMLWQLRNRAGGWIYWNLLLDYKGGPNLAGNYVDSPSFKVNQTAFALNPSFYHMAHFSRFVPPGSVQLDVANVTCHARHPEFCQFVAFRRPTDQAVVVVMTNDEITVGPVAGSGIGMVATPWLAKGQGSFTLGEKTLSWTVRCGAVEASGTLPWKSIQTVVLLGC